MIDLHLHSTISDGTWEPEEVVKQAALLGINSISLTDHERVGGIDRAINHAKNYGIEVIPGIEFFVMDEGYERHILGYLFDHKHPKLKTFLNQLRDFRNSQMAKILVLIKKEYKVDIPYSALEAISPTGFIGRAHIARVLAQYKVIEKPQDAFTPDYLASGGKVYLPSSELRAEDAIDVIREFGGIPTLAHAGYYGKIDIDEKRLIEMIDHGLQGIEVLHMKHNAEMVEQLTKWSEKFNLVKTGGSDCHGTVYDPVKIGTVPVPDSWLEILKQSI